MFRGALTIVVLLATIWVIGCSGDDESSTGGGDERFTRKASAADIDIQVRWLAGDYELEDELAGYPLDEFTLFRVSLDTHSGDLGSIDMVAAARFAMGGDSQEPEAWVSESDDSHHRSGVLVFVREAVTGSAALALDFGAESVEFGWDEAPEFEE
ncbi:MAG TPA: hypothetical protein VFP63_04900 [Dehalococcoidia bacterium]|nr:hypothetical protein [Dehalococcoidia bacterium]